MSDRIHDVEADTSEATVRALLAEQCPQWADRPLTYLRASGTDNAMWRVRIDNGDDLVVRLPRIDGAAAGVEKENRLLPSLPSAAFTGVATPAIRHAGTATDFYPYVWAILDWLPGTDAWTARAQLVPSDDAMALQLADIVIAIGSLRLDVALPNRDAGDRGGQLGPLLDVLDWWLTDPQWSAADLLDVAAIRRLAAESREAIDSEVVTGLTHGDLIPGNFLVADGRVSAVIDWAGAGIADLSQDLTPAWSMLDKHGRSAFREAMNIDDQTWLRARAFELEHAVGGVLYYTPRGHPLGDVMARTLHRILTDS